jgi:hypothetical protein
MYATIEVIKRNSQVATTISAISIFFTNMYCPYRVFKGCDHLPMLKGMKPHPNTIAAVRASNRIRVVSEETRRKMSESRKGKRHSLETRKKISLSNIGKRHVIKDTSNYFGRVPWNKGMKMSSDLIEKNRIAHLGQKQPWTGKPKSEEHKRKLSIARSKQVFPLRDTKIERIVQEYLRANSIVFEAHKRFIVNGRPHQVDIYVPSVDLPIECDGVYWHSLPNVLARDKEIDEVIHPLRLTENEILSGEYIGKLNSFI